MLHNILVSDNMIIMYVILCVILFGTFYFLYRIDKNKKLPYSIMDLIVDEGKIQERKVTRLGTWVVSTWGFIYLIIQNHLDEWYFVGYMSVWVANAILSKNHSSPESSQDSQDK